MFRGEASWTGFADRKQSENRIPHDERYGDPAAEPRERARFSPNAFFTSVAQVHTLSLDEYTLQEGVLACLEGNDRSRTGSGRVFTCHKQAPIRFRKDYTRAFVRNRVEHAGKQSIEHNIHTKVLGEGQGGFTEGLRLRAGGIGLVSSGLGVSQMFGNLNVC